MLFELDGHGPKYRQLMRALLAAIREGALPPGTRVPASRTLSTQLSIARNVVLLAYEQLLTEGYLVSRARGGTFVSPLLPAGTPERSRDAPKHARPGTPPASSAGAGTGAATSGAGARRGGHAGHGAHARTENPPSGLTAAGRRLVLASDTARAIGRWPREAAIDFINGVCEPDARLVGRLRHGFAQVLRDSSSFAYGQHPAGDERLRAEIARRLHGTRGIQRSADEIVITSGVQQGLDLCARLLLRRGDAVVIEDPGYEAARGIFAAAGATIVPVPVDRDGLDPAGLPRRLRRARLVYVTPSHQAPTGAMLSAARRKALLAWARARGAFVLEDDYDGELRYRGPPIKALAAMDAGSDVIYCGTFAKALFPSIRLGYLVLPEPLVSAVISAKWLSDRGSSLLVQRLVRELMTSGEYDRHIRRMQRRYAARRAALTQALHQHLGSDVDVSGDATGLHLVAWLPRLSSSDVDALVRACLARDVGVYSIARFAMRRLPYGGLILGYGLVDEQAIDTGVRRLAAAYRALPRPRRRHGVEAR